MSRRAAVLWCVLGLTSPVVLGQATSTASRRADLQVGAGFVSADSDYEPQRVKGIAFYATLDFTNHLGGEFVVHQVNSSVNDRLYERSYEIGPRYLRAYGPFTPYVKAMYGRGKFNFPQDAANLAYNMFAAGAGVDLRVLPYLNVRADYEYQKWLSFPPRGLTPQLFTLGVAYHVPGAMRRTRHF